MQNIKSNLSENVREVIYRLNISAEFSPSLLKSAFLEILNYPEAEQRDVLLGTILGGIICRKPSLAEIVGLIETAVTLDNFDYKNVPKVKLPPGKKLISIIGSGKKGHKTINISTPSAITAACLGAYIVKPGSFATSSTSGSRDFIEALGANVELTLDEMTDVLKKCGFAFFSIEGLIPKFNKVYGGKFIAMNALSFGLPAILCPLKTDNILYGLTHPNVQLSSQVLRELGVQNAMVVSATYDDIHFIDEIGLYGTTRLIGIINGRIGRQLYFQSTHLLQLPKYYPKDIEEEVSFEKNIEVVLDVLKGKGKQAHKDIIAANTGNLLYLSGLAYDLKDGYDKAIKVLERGEPYQKLIEFIELTGGDKTKLSSFSNLGI